MDIEILAPKGAKAISVHKISTFQTECEFLLQKGSNFLIKDVFADRTKSGKLNIKLIMELL